MIELGGLGFCILQRELFLPVNFTLRNILEVYKNSLGFLKTSPAQGLKLYVMGDFRNKRLKDTINAQT